ncbi:hypothetical protein [Microbulbifer aggregans]|uniref:hypothetical protein n=1 Tax=Microbulbifer aggregans TaxID=1769779 RepID=UPI001CFE083F|nr:hypothetical protein [Microbulbifer aggregans]
MSGQQKFQIVSSGKVLRAKKPNEVLAEMVSAFSISPQQARQLFLKGWVIKDQLSPGQVVQYRTQLQQIGLKIEVHPAGTFDNRALLARMQFAKQRQARKAAGNGVADGRPAKDAPHQSQNAAKAVTPPSSGSVAVAEPPKPAATIAAPVRRTGSAAAKSTSANAAREGDAPGQQSARKQLAALFREDQEALGGIEQNLAASRVRLLPGILAASVVPLLFTVMTLLVVYQAGVALWNIPSAILDGSFGVGTIVGSGLSLLLLIFFAVLFLLPYYRGYRLPESTAITLSKAEAPGLYLLLDVLGTKTGLPVPSEIRLTPGAEVEVSAKGLRPLLRGELTLSLGLSAVTTLNGGDTLALIGRALGYYQGRLGCLATWLLVAPARRLQAMQDALENEKTVLSADDGQLPAIARLPHRLLAASGLALVPVVDRLQSLHRSASQSVGRTLAGRVDTTAACFLGSEGFSEFVAHWHQLNHADLVTGEINREAQLVGKRLSDYPAAVRWLYGNLDEETRSSLELAMEDDTDLWSLSEPIGTARLYEVEDREFASVLARTDFSLVKLFADIRELSSRVSRIGVDEHCRAVENRSLMAASKEAEQAQKVLAEYFNRIVPRDLLPLELPSNEDLQRLDLQRSVDWLRSRLIELQDLEQRYNTLQLHGARIQLGAGLIRGNAKVQPADYQLSGATPASADESLKDNQERIKDCQQQRGQILAMFYQRIHKAIESMDTGPRNQCQAALRRLQAFEQLRAPLANVERYGDLASILVERMPAEKIPQPLLQKYVTVALQQCEKLAAAVERQSEVLGGDLSARLAGFEGGRAVLAGEGDGKSARDSLSQVQALELHCKSFAAQVSDAYQQNLAALLQECLAEEGRRKVRPLRLVGAL